MGGRSVRHASVSIASRVTLYALWEPKMYIVHFDKNGADYGKMPDTYALYDDSVDPGENMFLRFGYNFAGWEDEQGNKYGISEAIPTLSDGDTESIRSAVRRARLFLRKTGACTQ